MGLQESKAGFYFPLSFPKPVQNSKTGGGWAARSMLTAWWDHLLILRHCHLPARNRLARGGYWGLRCSYSPAAMGIFRPSRDIQLTQTVPVAKEAALWLVLFPEESSRYSSSLALSFYSSEREGRDIKTPVRAEAEEKPYSIPNPAGSSGCRTFVPVRRRQGKWSRCLVCTTTCPWISNQAEQDSPVLLPTSSAQPQ